MSHDWFRSWHGAPVDAKWRTIAKRAGVPTSLVVSFMWALMDRASQSDDRGSFAGADLEALADYFDCYEDDLKRIVTQCNARNVTCDGRFVSWEKRQPKRPDDNSKERVRAFRERQRNQSTYDDVTQCNAVKRNVTLDKIREDKNIDTNVSIAASPKPKRAKPKSKISEDAQPTDRDRQVAFDAGLHGQDFRTEWIRFRDYHISRGSLMADWQAAWRTWVSNHNRFAKPARDGPSRKIDAITAAIMNLESSPNETQATGSNPAIQSIPFDVQYVAGRLSFSDT